MDESEDMPKRPWDTCREVPIIEDEQTPWKLIKLMKIISMIFVGVIVFGLALCSKTSFLLLITLAHDGTKIIVAEEKPVVYLCIACALITSSVLLFLKSMWKACYKTSKLPDKATIAFVLFFEFLVSLGAAILTIVAMPHFDIVTNVTILNGVGILSALLQVISQCSAKETNRYLVPSITSVGLLLLGFVLFLVLYITKDPTNTKMLIWIGLAVGSCFLISFNWWENYFRLISENSRSVILKKICKDVTKCENILNMLSSLLRIAVTASVLGAYVPLSKLDWDVVTSISRRETKIIAIIIGVQLISSALCHWFSLVACKMHVLRRCFVLPLYFASLSVMALLVVPVIVFYYDHRASLNGTQINFTGYCYDVVYPRNQSLSGSMFPHLVYDVTHTLCFLDMSKMFDIGVLTGSAVSWWLGLVLATVHLWFINLNRIQRTQDLFVRRLYEGAFIEQSLLLNTRFNIQTKDRQKKFRNDGPVMLYLCATMWHETYDEMLNIIISIFRLDKYRPIEEKRHHDFTFEAHIYFDDAFSDIEGHEGRALNEYARNLAKVFVEVYRIFTNIDRDFFRKQQQIPDQVLVRTPYGGRLVIQMPHGNKILVHFKDKSLIRHKKRWSQIMYLYYLFGWKLMNKYFVRLTKGENEQDLAEEAKREKCNTYLLALDGDTDFQPAAVVLLIDRLKMYPRVGAACGRIHPTGSGPAVWFQKFEYAVSHWLQKTAEHVFGCVFCSPGCFSLFRAEALMDDNVMKRYATKSTEASHYIQYDQGEDRWLCTLLLKQGWRVEYNAASDAYTNAPEDFKELYNQRRRWGPSTLANVVDILGASTIVTKRNSSISKPFLLYQLFMLISAILAPATICLLIAGSIGFVLEIDASWALVLAVIPPAIYLILCFKLKSDTQILIAGILSVLYSFLMLVVSMSIIGAMIKDQTILTPSSIFVLGMAAIYIFTAMMHPQEFHLVFYGLLYIICIPSAYMLLIIYSMCNMNNVSWGTRETKAASGAPTPQEDKKLTTSEKTKKHLSKFCAWFKCCKKPSTEPLTQAVVTQENLIQEPQQQIPGPLNTIVEDEDIPQDTEQWEDVKTVNLPVHCWVTDLQNYSDDMNLQEEFLEPEEENFWRELQEEYLKPLDYDKAQQEAIASDLKELRNKITFVFFLINGLWLAATLTLQILDTPIYIPKVNLDLEYTGENIQLEPISFMFIVGFATSVVVQFFGMFYHRLTTLIHYVAFLDTESKDRTPELEILHIKEKKEEPVSGAAWQVDSDIEDSSFNDSDMSFEEETIDMPNV